ncbi:MAG: capsular polysaccharide biosynthesis protein, partial [Deltaproteobacteria bacterium]|nr:capsular polysaccharide biosynthesis protein [Deltaproteobacteria bacterium]
MHSSFVIGWGHKPTANKARRYALAHRLPYLALEDGFLRSLDLGCRGTQPLSMVVDHSGIYYDAGAPSDLENLLNSEGWETPELLESAQLALNDIKRFHLSKYNQAPDAPPQLWPEPSSPRVLVIDQTKSDASVTLGGAQEPCFRAMLDEALATYSTNNILVKTHPDVIAKKKCGYLTQYAAERGISVIATDYTPYSILNQADVVYAVTSQMGFEALMLDKKVHCFGLPFYAGWGLTTDHQRCSRRKKKRSLLEIFAATYLLYSRYINPISSQQCDIHETIGLLAEQKLQNDRNRRFHACLGFRRWKRPYAKAYLKSTGGQTAFFRGSQKALQAAWANGGEIVAWSSGVDEQLQKDCSEKGVTLARMEDGFIRSVGLGSNFNWPY